MSLIIQKVPIKGNSIKTVFNCKKREVIKQITNNN